MIVKVVSLRLAHLMRRDARLASESSPAARGEQKGEENNVDRWPPANRLASNSTRQVGASAAARGLQAGELQRGRRSLLRARAPRARIT